MCPNTFGSNLASVSSRNPTKESLFLQPKIVGLIGGVSAEATLEFGKKLVNRSNECTKDECGLPFILCSDQIRNKEYDDTKIVEISRGRRIFLERAGARGIVMPCHISHMCYYDEVSKGCSVPVLHMGERVAKELIEAKLKPLEAGSPLRIGILVTNDILKGGFYQDKLQKEGFEVIVPDKAIIEHTIIPSTEAISRKDIEGARNLLRIAIEDLLVRAENTFILASDDPLVKKCVDPLDSLARSTIKLAQSAMKGS